tara:strand:- start:323 stop:619 length:297 start_codon:yes stop_codon:yes gene_type:complete
LTKELRGKRHEDFYFVLVDGNSNNDHVSGSTSGVPALTGGGGGGAGGAGAGKNRVTLKIEFKRFIFSHEKVIIVFTKDVKDRKDQVQQRRSRLGFCCR